MDALQGSMTTLEEGSDAVAENGLLANLVAYWGMDEAAGANNASDKHTNALTLTQVNSPGSAAGLVYSGARTFAPASTQYFSRASETLLQVGDINFALAAWAYVTADSSGQIIAKYYNTGNQREYFVSYDATSDSFRFAVSANGLTATTIASGVITLNAWHLVIAYHDATNNVIAISADNESILTSAYSTGVFVGTSNFNIGASNNGASVGFTGRIGPVAFWKNRTLDAAARTALYNAGAGLAYAEFTN